MKFIEVQKGGNTAYINPEYIVAFGASTTVGNTALILHGGSSAEVEMSVENFKALLGKV